MWHDCQSFNTQPPEGDWAQQLQDKRLGKGVSTHSRPKAAGDNNSGAGDVSDVSTHSRPKAAGFSAEWAQSITVVSTHSRPKAAGVKWRRAKYDILFQHTAARRRLGISESAYRRMGRVSTHSRPKAAGSRLMSNRILNYCFNTQPPEGGWVDFLSLHAFLEKFQHTAARRRLGRANRRSCRVLQVSTHSRPKAAGRKRLKL